MAVRPIRQIGDPILRRPTDSVTVEQLRSPGVQKVVDDMLETMDAADGSGIAANQIGVSLAICAIGVTSNRRYPYKPPIPLTVLVNPELVPLDEERWLNNEGCLSVPLRGDLYRRMSVQVNALDRHGEPFSQVYRGMTAGTVQHEIDHLNGRLIVDRMEDSTSMSSWDNFADHGMAGYLQRIAPVIARTEPAVDDDG